MVSLESPEKVALEKRADKMAAEAMAEGEKLDKYGRIGQKVRVVGRFGPGGEEIVGGIIGINSNLPFRQPDLNESLNLYFVAGRIAIEVWVAEISLRIIIYLSSILPRAYLY